MLSFIQHTSEHAPAQLTETTYGLVSLAIFFVAYALVVTEDLIHLRKSKPVIMAAGLIWVLTSLAFMASGQEGLEDKIVHHVNDFGQLFLFLMVAMTYISAIAERNVFLRINAWLVGAGFGLRAVFWMTGLLAFIISPIADNLTTALLMGAVVCTVGKGKPGFIAMACTNVVVAANAGGAFSPFGDITTLMVWQAGFVKTTEFTSIFLPSLVNWLVPAIAMTFFIPKEKPAPVTEKVVLKEGWLLVIILFLLTIATAVLFHAKLHLPPFLGMTTGLGYFMFYGYFRRMMHHKRGRGESVDVFANVAEVEWDTLLFFFGVIMCVGGLTELGYLAFASDYLYNGLGPTTANVSIGVISAILDNVPVMFAVLGMEPNMSGMDPSKVEPALIAAESTHQWLLVTMTAGVGGSLLSVGSAAGVALMGSARGQYTFLTHLKWTPVIALGYVAAIWVHFLLKPIAVVS